MYTALVIGAGFSGIGAAIELRRRGIDDFVVLERAQEVGGTWRDNVYPGVACDVPSLLYSYSFEPAPWSKLYADGAEIQQYIRHVVDKYDVRRFVRFGHDVSSMTFDDAEGIWTVTTNQGQLRAKNVIASYGPLANPSLPSIDGLEDFGGDVIHSAAWDRNHDFSGQTVAVIGTGSTAVQLIPELVKVAGKVVVFQRTAGWVLPRGNLRTPPRVLRFFGRFPFAQGLVRAGLFRATELSALALVWNTVLTSVVALAGKLFLRREVRDPWLRRLLTPRFRPGCKRMLVSDDYLKALQAENCQVIAWPIARIGDNGVMTCEGVEHLADAIVCATGYEVTKAAPPIDIVGRNGKSLNADWARGAFAYKSVSVAGYPNLFFTFGPNAGPGHTSALVYMEAQIQYAAELISLMVKRKLTWLEVDAKAQADYNEWLQHRLEKSTWNSGGCDSWYLTEDGFNATMFPGFATTYQKLLRDIDLHHYRAAGDLELAIGGPRTADLRSHAVNR
ncbi:flavin-containing monooxygenase [Gordonia sp. NPDC058843]|uniref:flavin-containing monooxygenase n=1 Tax=Gordonia sp. NPDC058843 TaxID=3346648 RepID=UPI0036A9B2CD